MDKPSIAAASRAFIRPASSSVMIFNLFCSFIVNITRLELGNASGCE
jgi:hypothetical protein